MRYIHQGVAKDGNGKVIREATVSVYLAGTTTPATVYADESGGGAINEVTTDSVNGSFEFWVDTVDYTSVSQNFKIIISKTGFNPKTFDDLVIFNSDITQRNPKWFGNSVDSTEYAANIAAYILCFDNVSSPGGEVFIPEGTHSLGGGRVDASGAFIYGSGKQASKVVLVDDGQMPSIPVTSLIQATTGFKVKDISFDNTDYALADDVRVIWPQAGDIEINSCEFVSGSVPVLMGTSSVGNFRVLNSDFLNPDTGTGNPVMGIQGGTVNAFVVGNLLETSTDLTGSICSVNTQAENLIVLGNIIGGAYVAGVLCESQDADKTIISNNVIDISSMDVSEITNGVYFQFSKRGILSSSHLVGNDNGSSVGVKIQIASTDVATEKLIQSSTIEHFGIGVDMGEFASSTYATLRDLTIQGCVIKDIVGDGIRVNAQNSNATEEIITIQNNKISDCGTRAMNIWSQTGAGNFIITGNTIKAGDTTSTYVISITGGFNTLKLGGNFLINPSPSSLYSGAQLKSLSTTDFSNIDFLDKKEVYSDEIDLSGSAFEDMIPVNAVNRIVLGIFVVYTEDTSADAGVVITVEHFGTGGEAYSILGLTSDTSVDSGYINETLLPDGAGNMVQVRTGFDAGFKVSCPGGKTGTGKCRVRIEYLENPGPLL